jgi:hypothetical protein
MELFSIFILLLAAIFLWWVIKERSRNERERQVSVELVNRLFRLDERILKLEAAYEQQVSRSGPVGISVTQIEERPVRSLTEASTETAVNKGSQFPEGRNGGPNAQSANFEMKEQVVTPTVVRPISDLPLHRHPAPSYVNGTSITANGNRNNSLIAPTPFAPNALPEPPKLGEFGMAALLCGIAFLMKDGQAEPHKTTKK